jgi:hypothetical protein
MWAKARSKLGAVVHLCRDGVMPNAAIMGVFRIVMHPFHAQNRTVRDPPPHSGCAKMVFLIFMDVGEGQKQTRCCGSPVRRRGDAECSENWVVLHIVMHPLHTQNRTVRTHHRTPGAQRWCSRLAMDVGEGQEQFRCIDSPVRRRGDGECSENCGVCVRSRW